MSIYTRSGDKGETSLGDGSRASKCDVRIEAYGALDEAITAVGFARVVADDGPLDDALTFIQQKLFNCSAALVTAGSPLSALATHDPASPSVDSNDIAVLEAMVDGMMATSGPMSGFVLPGGSEVAARCHLARVAVRRAERRIAALAECDVDPQVLSFVNRCSDALYAAARFANASSGTLEEPWDPKFTAPASD